MLYSVTVKPGTSQEKIVTDNTPHFATNSPSPISSNTIHLTIYLRAKAIDGAANTALIKLLSKHFHVPKTSIKILRGATSRYKLIEL